MPNKAEATKMFGAATEVSEVPVIIEAVAHSEDRENNSFELMMQSMSNYELGYEGLAIQVEQFRAEMEEMPQERFTQEDAAVKANLRLKEYKPDILVLRAP
jgi:hypothetical protein